MFFINVNHPRNQKRHEGYNFPAIANDDIKRPTNDKAKQICNPYNYPSRLPKINANTKIILEDLRVFRMVLSRCFFTAHKMILILKNWKLSTEIGFCICSRTIILLREHIRFPSTIRNFRTICFFKLYSWNDELGVKYLRCDLV